VQVRTGEIGTSEVGLRQVETLEIGTGKGASRAILDPASQQIAWISGATGGDGSQQKRENQKKRRHRLT
jgi:hypothetical protein